MHIKCQYIFHTKILQQGGGTTPQMPLTVKNILRVTQETYYMMQNWQPLIATGMGTYNGTPYLLTSENVAIA